MDSVTDDGFLIRRVSPFGNLRIDAYVPLPEAYRSLSRPSSAPDAKAFPLRSFSLNLVGASSISFAPPQAAELTHSAAPPLPRESSFARMETGVTKLAPDIGSLNYAGSFRISSKLFYPFKVPQLLLNFLLLPCLSFLCSVFNVQIVDASSRTHSLRCISSSSQTFVHSDGDEGHDIYPLN